MDNEKTICKFSNEPVDFVGTTSPFYRPDLEARINRALREHPQTTEDLKRVGWEIPKGQEGAISRVKLPCGLLPKYFY